MGLIAQPCTVRLLSRLAPLVILLPILAQFRTPAAPASSEEAAFSFAPPPGLYALFYTSEGNFACLLFEREVNRNVRNFVDLALGNRVWTDPRTGRERRDPYYDGLPIYHVAANAMIAGGDPLCNGTGSPGYFVEDEIRDDITFDEPGMLAMANLKRPNTNSGTWFITVAPLPNLNGKYTIIGKVFQGFDVVRKISRIPADHSGKPRKNVIVRHIDVVRVLSNGRTITHAKSNFFPYIELPPFAAHQHGLLSEEEVPAGSQAETRYQMRLPALPPIYGDRASGEETRNLRSP